MKLVILIAISITPAAAAWSICHIEAIRAEADVISVETIDRVGDFIDRTATN